MQEGNSAPADVAVREAYDYAGLTWDFYNQLFNRNSIDGRGLTMVSSVHYSENGAGFDNALWNGQQMIYGDGGELFDRMTKCLDVVAHELTHGVTQYSAGLPYQGQSGALNESMSDVFGVVVRQWHESQADPATANWLVGDKLMLSGDALRSMKAPGTANPDDPQTDTHGTQVAGLLAATIDNVLGVAGLAGRVKILPMKVVGSGALTSRPSGRSGPGLTSGRRSRTGGPASCTWPSTCRRRRVTGCRLSTWTSCGS